MRGQQGGRRYPAWTYDATFPRMTRDDRLRAVLITESSRLRLVAARACNPFGGTPETEARTLATLESIAEELRRAVAKFKGGV